MTAVSSRKVESGYCSSGSNLVNVRPHCCSAAQYASCCSRARAKCGTPNRTLVSPSAKVWPGGRTIALESIYRSWSATSCEEGLVVVQEPTNTDALRFTVADRKAALLHQCVHPRVAAAEGAVPFSRIDRVADRKYVLAQACGNFSIIRTTGFDERSIRISGQHVGPQIAVIA